MTQWPRAIICLVVSVFFLALPAAADEVEAIYTLPSGEPVLEVTVSHPARPITQELLDGMKFRVTYGEDEQRKEFLLHPDVIGPELPTRFDVQETVGEVDEETGLTAGTLEPLIVVVHDYEDRSVRLHCFVARDPAGDVAVESGREWAWVTGDRLGDLEMPAANAAIVRALKWRLAGSSDVEP